jgi:hypothetical protein
MTLETATPLPASHVLSYVANVSTPTRVRRVAAGAVLFLAIIEFCLAAICLARIAYAIFRDLALPTVWIGPPPGLPPPGFTARNVIEAIRVSLDMRWGEGLFYLGAGIAFPLGVLHFFLSRAVRRGRPVASLFASTTLIPHLFGLFVSASYGLGAALVMGFGLAHFHRSPYAWVALVSGLIAVVLLLTLKDVCLFLLWIARQPHAERPAVAILPRLPVRDTPGVSPPDSAASRL